MGAAWCCTLQVSPVLVDPYMFCVTSCSLLRTMFELRLACLVSVNDPQQEVSALCVRMHAALAGFELCFCS
jgi:hypothetical protein